MVDSQMAQAAVTEHLLRVKVFEEFSNSPLLFFQQLLGCDSSVPVPLGLNFSAFDLILSCLAIS
jgi:hypothetical protein